MTEYDKSFFGNEGISAKNVKSKVHIKAPKSVLDVHKNCDNEMTKRYNDLLYAAVCS
jgi:hypothetical protein